MPTASDLTPTDDDTTASRCPNCLAEGVARSVVTVPGRPVVLVTIVCQSCGQEWTVEHAIAY